MVDYRQVPEASASLVDRRLVTSNWNSQLIVQLEILNIVFNIGGQLVVKYGLVVLSQLLWLVNISG